MTQATLKDTKKFDTKEVYVCLDFVVDNLLKKVLATIIIYRSEYVNLCLRKHKFFKSTYLFITEVLLGFK